ncbi:MAG: aldehyde dehydrogenase (NADP(+)) [Sphingomonas sp.]
MTGEFFIAGEAIGTQERFKAINPATGEAIEPGFSTAGTEHVARACEAAAAAFDAYSGASREDRAAFLESIADEIMALGDELLERAHVETGLPMARLTGERARTCGQLKLFASVVRDGGWMDIRIDPAMPDRQPLPRPDLRLYKVPLGPVAVFGASNFPLAFSVAGGDTASALAAGCPVVVKGHPAHPGTTELTARAINAAVAKAGFPAGVFSMVSGTSNELGGALVADPRITAVGFTGSRGGGLALMNIAAKRPVPIPVYAEMSSINPVLLMPAALENRGEALAKGFATSLTMGSGQFCTNPGLVIAIDSPALDKFIDAAAEALAPIAPSVMLTPGIHAAYEKGLAELEAHDGVTLIGRGTESEGKHCARAALLSIPGEKFIGDEVAAREIFGSASLVVKCRDADEVAAVLESLEGQLTATLQLDQADEKAAARFVPILQRKAGRVLANGWPTGVEVSHAMVHGGPFPATSDGRSTSVGTLAIDRYLRPVCFQDMPESLLPAALRGEGSASVPHRFDGVLKTATK